MEKSGRQQDAAASTSSAETVTVAVPGTPKPYNYVDDNGKLGGYEIDMLSAMAEKNEDGSVAYGLIPIDLTMENERVLERGLPKIASTEVAEQIAEHMTTYSAPYGMKLTYDKESGLIRIT